MDEQMNNNEMSNKKLVDLLTELAQVQAEYAILSAKIFVREGKEQVDEKVNEISSAMQEQAKLYGKKAQELAQQYSENSEQKGNILQEYKQALYEINNEYAKRMKVIIAEKQELESEEQETYSDEKILKLEKNRIKKSPEYLQHMEEEKNLTSEIKKALTKGDLDVVTQKTEELKALKARNPLTQNEARIDEVQKRRKEIEKLLDECEQNIEDCKDERHDKIEEITSNKNKQLAVIPKQNIFQKMFGNLLNKLNGFEKFKNNVIADIMSKIETIKTEQLPVVKKMVQEKSEQFVEEVQNKREQIKQKTIETRDAVTDKVVGAKNTVVEKTIGAKDSAVRGIQNIKTTIQDRANQTITNIVNRGRLAKETIKLKLQQSIEEKREKNVQLLSKDQESKSEELESDDNIR